MEHSQTKSVDFRRRFGWYLFDFANSILIINGGLYIPQWLVIDNGVSDFWYNAVLALSSILLLFTGPYLGLLSDRGARYFSFLKWSSLAMFVAGLVLGIGGRFLEHNTSRAIIGLIAIFVILYFYQLSLVFYNVMLKYVSKEERQAITSGSGFAWGWIGGILGILCIMPFVDGKVPFFQPAGRIQSILPSTIVFGFLTLWSLWWLRGIEREVVNTPILSVKEIYRNLWTDLKDLPRQKNLWWFLLAYLLFSDAILTIQNNVTIYMEAVHHFTDNIKAYLFLALLIASAIGGVLSGYLAPRIGLKRGLMCTLFSWIILIAIAGVTHSGVVFGLVFIVMGLFNGTLWNYSRVLFYSLLPQDKAGEFFGVYSSYERFASILGPMLWSVPFLLFPASGALRYHWALIFMAPLVVGGALSLSRIDDSVR